jgi:hypothetical protein
MPSLEEKIANLEEEIAGYTEKLAKAEGDRARENILLTLMASSRDVLKELMVKQREEARGTVFLRRSPLLLNNALFSGSIKMLLSFGAESRGGEYSARFMS